MIVLNLSATLLPSPRLAPIGSDITDSLSVRETDSRTDG